jgi:signal transduction histidine kinase
MNRSVVISFVWLLCTCLSFGLHAQKVEKIDRLKSELAHVQSDTAEIRILLTIAMNYEGYQMDSALAYAQRTLEKSKSIDNKKGIADATLHIGRLKRDLFQEAEALPYMFDALKIYREIGDSVQIAHALNDISIVYANSYDNKNALEYFKQALEIFRRMKDEKGESYALNNIGILYQDMGDNAAAKDHYLQSLKIKIKNKDLYGISRGYTNLGSISEDTKSWDEAWMYYFKADSIYTFTNDKQGKGQNSLAMARVKLNQNNVSEARRLAVRSFEISKEISNLGSMARSSEFLAELDEKAGNYKSALLYQKIHNNLADSLSDKDHEATVEELKAKFNIDDRERKIALLTKDKELSEVRAKNNTLVTYILSGGVIVLLLISGLIFFAYRTTKSARDSLASKNKEIEQQRDDLDKLNREKDRFFSILSHDLRSPLNALKGLSYLLVHHGDILTNEESKEIKKKIDTSLDNLTDLINNILDWSVTSAKKKHWTFDKVDASALIEKNISLYQNIAESKGVKLVHPSGDEIFGYADNQAIDTVLRNLLSNSIKFSHPNSEVTVKAAVDENRVLISVQDHGIGIPTEVQDRLFTVDSSVTQTGTKNEKGAGIGLVLCKELMKENNGDISVKSRPGEGSEFFVSFPAFDHV